MRKVEKEWRNLLAGGGTMSSRTLRRGRHVAVYHPPGSSGALVIEAQALDCEIGERQPSDYVRSTGHRI